MKTKKQEGKSPQVTPEAQPKAEAAAVICLRAFDAPYRGTRTYYQEGQAITAPQEIAYLRSIKAPVTEKE